jgi:hypothetical protein
MLHCLYAGTGMEVAPDSISADYSILSAQKSLGRVYAGFWLDTETLKILE